MTQRGIYLLPNVLTTVGLLAGFFSIITATRAVYQGVGLFETAAIAILVAGIFDGLDGRVARLTNTQSEFGAQYDSLADIVAFGVAPAVLVFSWSLSALGKLGWVAAFIYVAGTALRLARFNVQREATDSNYFVGLACPAAAFFLASAVWSLVSHQIQGETVAFTMVMLTAVCGLLMVSSIPYPSFKNSDLKARVSLLAIMAAALLFAFISLDPPRVLLLLTTVYLISGPVLWTRQRIQGARVPMRHDDEP
ncbi:MAG: CDP-diacylglycerol--serine O-phosphatidyltransferase [Litorivicinaceae bacterium]|jgi:CDP-diacylglycerol---serine O-phosphatidyltransferase|nr:CDP-diacylglycerol--serine O-phosphatidyltransferase [Litorivicinaceae bacterium]MDP5328629.1 CDP-diacylglycerol--serine O-phosphatidyltransferase [Litorivicinaceae bacterium]MDP5330577.1 CDP-diacylglycerol--serine O-phosphatidyltransferase [Litorivicinaceae bacterium]MDP5340653.1 CDP-diacylglycerol--serine O-phosphatidyltransferase [Litorivicinaceae bacterium]MDP5341944.1 CDP-diacylglycerol--serine O-phosphatidyltransferase [Litorivicinaceae bacterium]